MLNPNSPIPLYHQLADLLIEQIQSGIYQPGDMLPSEISISKKFGIGRPTVRQAMEVLLKKHLIERKRGAGTFVKPKRREIDLFSLAGTSQAFSTKGIETRSKIITPISIHIPSNDTANPFNGKRAFFLVRLTLLLEEKENDDKAADGKTDGFDTQPLSQNHETIESWTPVLLEEIYLHSDLFPGLDAIDLKNRSLSRIISDQYYQKPTTGRQSFKVSHLTEERANQLQLKSGDSILEVERTLDFPNAPSALFSRLFCKTDLYAFSQTILLEE